MGIDVEFADVAAARCQFDLCQESGRPCGHDPSCSENLDRLHGLGRSDFSYRQFRTINENMQLTGMGYEAKPEHETALEEASGDTLAYAAADLRWRSQTVPGKTGIPAFKLRSNDRWLVTPREIDEALAAYAQVPAEQRASLETDSRWVSWLEWLALARERGGFEAD